jgi:hypothetical protein
MRFAKKVLLCALFTFMVCAAGFAQTPRPESDPRNQSPAVGTGGTEGGPTGLFTVYDGSTIRRGEYTFSIAYSNYDRDPGDVDITDIPVSFNIGLNDHIELFFKANTYRGIKTNSPRNLSGLYLPNIAFSFPAVVQRAAGMNATFGSPIFRPLGNQPFVNFPFAGGSAGLYGLNPALFTFTLGAPVGGGGSFGAAANYPGYGSAVGGILPGIVLATVVIPPTPGHGSLTVPLTYTVAPSYLPDAPFLGRTWGESELNNMVFGGKIRFTGPNNPLGVGIIPFYRWWHDKGNNASGFRDLQRGAGPGGAIGDFGLIGFIDGRLSKHVNLSANAGIIRNSNPKDPSGHVLLDRPDEFLTGIGIDFPINKHFQPIFELRDTWYVGARTPNAFENNPLELIAGAKIYPRRWFGFGLAYRRHLNDQSRGRFNSVGAVSSAVTIINPAGGTVTIAQPTGGPQGFRFSDDPNGFIVQAFAGHRNAREPEILPNRAPVIASFTASTPSITLPCPPGEISKSGTCPIPNMQVQLTTSASDPDGDTLLYTYTVTGGHISGDGPNVGWDLAGVTPGTYTASVEVDDGCGCISFSSTTVTVVACPDCMPPCPTLNVSCPSDVDQGTPVTFTANVNGGPGTQTYNWSVSAGTISSGQGTSTITVDTANQGGQTITATIELGGLDPSCGRTASCTVSVKAPILPRKFDEYGNIRFNDEKARLDNYAIQLQNEPSAQGYILAFGSCEGEGPARANRAKDYLVNTRGIDAGRLVIVDGGCMPQLKVELWIRPSGASEVPVDTANAVSPCPPCKKKPKPVRRPRARHGEEEDEDQ